MQLTIIVICRGCGATLIPVNTDTAWLETEGLATIQDNIRRHRLSNTNCPYQFEPERGVQCQ